MINGELKLSTYPVFVNELLNNPLVLQALYGDLLSQRELILVCNIHVECEQPCSAFCFHITDIPTYLWCAAGSPPGFCPDGVGVGLLDDHDVAHRLIGGGFVGQGSIDQLSNKFNLLMCADF